MQKWQQNFKGCRQEKKEEAATLRKRLVVAGDDDGGTYFHNGSRSGEVYVRYCVPIFRQEIRRFCPPPQAQMPGKVGGRRNSEDEQEQGKASQQLALSV